MARRADKTKILEAQLAGARARHLDLISRRADQSAIDAALARIVELEQAVAGRE